MSCSSSSPSPFSPSHTAAASPLAPELRQYAFAGTLSDVSADGLADLLTGYRLTLFTMLALNTATVLSDVPER